MVFHSLESVVDFDFNAPAFAKRVKKSGPAYIVMKVLQMFREQEKRDPSPGSRDADILKLLNIRDEYSTTDVIPDTYFDHVFGQISPSAAITGKIQLLLQHCKFYLFAHFFFRRSSRTRSYQSCFAERSSSS